jgi:cytoskeleton protein RodZ
MNDELTHPDDAEPPSSLPETPPVAERQGAGAQLRAARERLNLSLEDIAHQIKSAPRKLAALEAERWGELPERPYLRGLIRNYARLLHLDPEPLLRAADAAKGAEIPSSDFNLKPTLHAPFPHRPAGAHESPVGKLMMLGVLVCAVVIGAIVLPGTAPFHEVMLSLEARLHHDSTQPVAAENAPPGMSEQINNAVTSPAQASSGAPASITPARTGSSASLAPASSAASTGVPLAMQATAPAATSGSATPLTRPAAGGAPSAPASAMLVASADQTGAASQGKALHLQFDDDSWVEVRQSDGKLVSSQIFRSGTEQAIDASAPLEVVIGNAPAVKASYRGKPIDLDPYTHARVAHLSIP